MCAISGEGGARRRLSLEAHYDKTTMAQAMASLQEETDMPPPALNCLRVYFQARLGDTITCLVWMQIKREISTGREGI